MAGLNREWFGKITQAVTGHGWLRRHCFLLREGSSPTCRLCSRKPEEPGHLFWDCPALCGDTGELAEGFFESPDKVERMRSFLKIGRFKGLLGTEDPERGSETSQEETVS